VLRIAKLQDLGFSFKNSYFPPFFARPRLEKAVFAVAKTDFFIPGEVVVRPI
jgi:hypothetical protein